MAHLSGLQSVFPFNEYEYRLMFLLNKKVISFQEYETLRGTYVAANPYLHLFRLSPRVFGEVWAQQHLIDVDARFRKASKTTDEHYSGEYDLSIKNGKRSIKVEVKASRAINTKERGGIEETALYFKSKEPYWMNFQQLKLDVADVFVFIGVWVDAILYWVLTNDDITKHPTRSHQHRGGIEYQIGITNKNSATFKKFLVKPKSLVRVIKRNVKK